MGGCALGHCTEIHRFIAHSLMKSKMELIIMCTCSNGTLLVHG